MKPKRIFRILMKALGYLFLVILLIGFGFAVVFHNQIRTLLSFKKIPNTNLYIMHYYGSYNIHKVYENGIDVSNIERSVIRTYFPDFVAEFLIENFLPEEGVVTRPGDREHAFACSALSYRTESDVYFGCNYEMIHDPSLILIRHGSEHNSSVGFTDLHYLLLDNEKLADLDFVERLGLLLAPYVVMEGFNDHGVAISEMSVENIKPPIDPDKPMITNSLAIRLVLDYAKSVDEALEIINRFNVCFMECQCHFMIADVQGKSVVVEFGKDTTYVIPASYNWQVSTNHLLHGKAEADNHQRCQRYKIASEDLRRLDSVTRSDSEVAPADLLDILVNISDKERTQWTGLYDLKSGDFQVIYRNCYGHIYEDRLAMRQ